MWQEDLLSPLIVSQQRSVSGRTAQTAPKTATSCRLQGTSAGPPKNEEGRRLFWQFEQYQTGPKIQHQHRSSPVRYYHTPDTGPVRVRNPKPTTGPGGCVPTTLSPRRWATLPWCVHCLSARHTRCCSRCHVSHLVGFFLLWLPPLGGAEVPRGTESANLLEGSLEGVVGSLLIAAFCAATGLNSWSR